MNANEYRSHRKESFRNDMKDIKSVLTDLSDIATRKLTIKKPYVFKQNKVVV